MVGNLNGDNNIDANDAAVIWDYLAGKKQLTEIEKLAADVNGDGRIDAEDIYSIIYGISLSAINLNDMNLIGDPSNDRSRTAATITNGSEIDSSDARMVLRAADGEDTALNRLLSDYNMDYNVSEADARVYLRAAVGLGATADDENVREVARKLGVTVDELESTDTAAGFVGGYLSTQLGIAQRKAGNVKYSNVRNSAVGTLLPTLTEEGTYKLTIGRKTNEDNSNYNVTEEYTIIIDRTAPQVTDTQYSTEEVTNGNVSVNMTFSEPVGELITGPFSDHQTAEFAQNDTKTLVYYDQAGNPVMVPVSVDWINKDGPVLKKVTYNPTTVTNGDVTVKLEFVDKVKIDLADESEEFKTDKTITVSENGVQYITVYDETSNPLVVPVVVTNIDKEAPIYLNSTSSLVDRNLGVDVTFNEDIAQDSVIKLQVKVDGETIKVIEPDLIYGAIAHFNYYIPINYSGNVSATIVGTVSDTAGNAWGGINVSLIEGAGDDSLQQFLNIDILDIGVVKQTGIVDGETEYTVTVNGKPLTEDETFYINNYDAIKLNGASATESDCTVDSNNHLTAIKGQNVSNFNIYIHVGEPTISEITAYPEVTIKDNRYIENKKIMFKVSSDIELAEANIDIQVGFSVSGVGKYNFDGTAGKARFLEIDGKDVYYTYEIQPGDEGTIMYIIKSGTVKDIYGNTANLADQELTAEELPRGTEEINYILKNQNIELKWIKEDASGKVVPISTDTPTEFIPGEKLKLTVICKDADTELSEEFRVTIYTDHGGITVERGAFTQNANEYQAVWTFTQKERMAGYAVVDGTVVEEDEDENVHRDANIYADTTRPKVTIEADKTSPTKDDVIKYIFTFSEQVRGFGIDKIIVNNGTKGTFSTISEGWSYSLEVTANVNTGSQEIVEVRVEDGACVDIVNKDVVGAVSKIVVDKVKPELQSDIIILPIENDGKVTQIKITETFSEAINIERNETEDDPAFGEFINDMVTPTINIGGKPGYGKLELVADELTPTSVTYLYTVSGADDGEVVVTAAGKVIDLAGNESENISRTVNTGINLTRTTIIIDGKEVAISTPSGMVTDFEKDIYLKANDTITVTVIGETNTDYTITVSETEPADGLYRISVSESGASLVTTTEDSADIPKIHVDKTAPEISVDVNATDPVTSGLYTEGSEFIINVTTNEEAYIDSTKDSYVKVWFMHEGATEGTEGAFNGGKALYVGETKNADNTVTYTYRYVASEGDYGTLSYRTVGTFVDLAGNSNEYKDEEESNAATTVSTIKVDAARPTVAIKALDKNGNVIYHKGFNDESSVDKITNADEITYAFTWSEKVTGFTEDDVILSSTLEKVYEDGKVAFKEPEAANADGTYTYTLKVKTIADIGIAKVVIPAGAVEDTVGLRNIENNLELAIDKIPPVLVKTSAVYDESAKTITIEAEFDEELFPTPGTQSLKATVKTDTTEVDTDHGTRTGNKVKFVYNIKGNESGDVKITLSGRIADKVHNIHYDINVEVENDIVLRKIGIVTEDEKVYRFKKGSGTEYLDISEPVYLKRGETVTIYEITINEEDETEIATPRGSHTVAEEGAVTDERLTAINGIAIPEDVNIIVDTHAPTLNKKIYVDEALETGRYTSEKEIIIELTTNEELDPKTVTAPEVLVGFTNSGIGKYNYDESKGAGYARLSEVINNADNTITWKYIYKVQNGDEGKTIVSVKTDLTDLAGNKNEIRESMPIINPNNGEAKYNDIVLDSAKDLKVSYKFYKNGEEINPDVVNSFNPEDEIKVVATFNKKLYKRVGESTYIEVIEGLVEDAQFENYSAPKLNIEDSDGGTIEVELFDIALAGDEMIATYKYEFEDTDIPDVPVQITNVVLNKDVPSGTAASTYFVEYTKDGIEYTIDKIVDDVTSNYHYVNYQTEIRNINTDICSRSMFIGEVKSTFVNSIYADTTRPIVEITSNEGIITNAEEITYTFKWSENVINFTEDDIEVINGIKKSGTFTKVSDDEYTIVIIPTIQDAGDLHVKVEAMACQDLAGLENVERISETTRIDRLTPIIVGTPTVRRDSDKIIVEATFSKEIENAKTSDINVVIGGEDGKGTKDSVQVDGNKVTYIYNISPEDNGELEITITGTVTDKAGNVSRELRHEVETTLEIVSTLGTTYTYAKKENAEAEATTITSFNDTTYLIAGNILEITKTIKTVEGTEIKTYALEVDEETANGLINYVKLNDVEGEDVGTIEIVTEGTAGALKVSGKNLFVDTVAPEVAKKVYVEEALETGRYTFGREIIIDVTTDDEIDLEKSVTPEIKVGFTKSGIGKYNYDEGKGAGFAKLRDTLINEENHTLTYRFVYKIQNEDEGEVITTYTAGKIVDFAGNEKTLEVGEIPESIDINEEEVSLRLVIDEAKGIYGDYELYRGESETPIQDFSRPIKFNPGEKLKIKLTFNEPIVYLGSTGSDERSVFIKDALKLKINDTIEAENELESEITVTEDVTPAITQVWTYTFGDEPIVLNSLTLDKTYSTNGDYYVTAFGEDTDRRELSLTNVSENGDFKVKIDNLKLELSGLNIFAGNYDIQTNIYADTLKPTVKITALNSRGNATTKINGQENVKFTFKWDEVVTGFTVDDIEVTNGTIVEGTFAEVKPGLEYTVNVKPNETEGELHVKVEADSCKDLVGLGNVARVSDTIEIDTMKPRYQSGRVYRQDDKIIIEATFDEKIDDASNLVATILMDGTPATGVSAARVEDTKVIYTYDIKRTDNGIVTVKINGKVSDLAENESDEIDEIITSEIELVSEIGTRYTYKLNGDPITDFASKKYLNANNNKLTIIKTVIEEDDGEVVTTETTYEGSVSESTPNGKLTKVTLVDPEAGETVGTIEFGTGEFNVEPLNIYIDTILPTATTVMKAVNPKTSERYTVGDEFVITVTASEEISEDSEIPVIGVNFGKNPGRFNRGEAQFVAATVDEETKATIFTYRYVATIGDEGEPILEYKSGTLVDLAGNENPLVKDSEVNVEIDANNSYGVTKIEFLDKDGNPLKENSVLPEELYVKLHFADGLYTNVNTAITTETAPSLYLNEIKGTTESVTISAATNYIVYKFTELPINNIVEIEKLELKNENATKLYAGSDNINSATEIAENEAWDISIDNSGNELIINDIYIDTTAPMVEIIPEKDPTNAHIDENKNEVVYTLKWNEKVNGFDESAIKVNYGQIIEDSFTEVEGSNGLEYTFKVKPNTTIGHVGHLEVIVEKDRCIDEVGLGNIRTESNITIDKMMPIYESYIVDDTATDEDGNKVIVVLAKFNEEIGDASNSKITVKVDGRDGNGTIKEPVSIGDKVKYVYVISPLDDGKVEIELSGTVKDVAGNPSNELRVNVENDIELIAGVIEIDGIKYSFEKEGNAITNFIEPTYFKEGQTITVTKVETRVQELPEDAEEGTEPDTEVITTKYDYKVENKYDNNTHITKMTLTEPEEGEEKGTASFENGLDISLANIYFDTTMPTLTEEIITNENGKNIYGTNEEIVIKLTTSETVSEASVTPKLAVRFGGVLGNYNAGEAKLTNTEVIDGLTVWTYTYKVVPSDNGELSTQFTAGTLVDLAENETELTNLNIPEVREGSTILTDTIKELSIEEVNEETEEVTTIDNSATVTYDIYRNETLLTNFDRITEFKPDDEIKVVARINKKIYEAWGSVDVELTKEKAPELKINNSIEMDCDSVAFDGYNTNITYTYKVSSEIDPSQITSLNLKTNSVAQYYTDETHKITNRSDDNIAYITVAGDTTVDTEIKGLKLVFNKYEKVTIAEGTFADTVLPEVTIVAKVGEDVISNLSTNSDTIDYELTWSEEVDGFTVEDITVNNGTKGTLSEAIENPDGTYTYKIRVTGIQEGTTQIIVEANKVLDKAHLSNPRQEMKISVDNTAPIYVNLDAYAESTDELKLSPEIDTVREYYREGDIITVTATFNENIIAETKPVLSLQFSESGNAKGTVSEGTVNGNKIEYTYTITAGDNGELSVKGYTGTVTDMAGNEARVTRKSIDGDRIVADTISPRMKQYNIISPEPGTYTVGTEVFFEYEYTEEVYNVNKETNTIELFTVENMPVEVIKIGDSDDIELTSIGYGTTDGKVDRTKLIYKYVIQDGDNGSIRAHYLIHRGYLERDYIVCDLAGNIERGFNINVPGDEEAVRQLSGPNNSKVKADTLRPEISTNGITARVENPTISGTGNYYKEDNEVTITLKFNEPVKPSVADPVIKVGFSETADEPEENKYREIDTIEQEMIALNEEESSDVISEENGEDSIVVVPEEDQEEDAIVINPYQNEITYKYSIQEGDNGNLWVIVPENQFEDEAGNKNIAYQVVITPAENDDETDTIEIVGTEITTVYADTTRPTLTIYEDTETVQSRQTITVTARFSEDVYELRDNTRVALTPANAPKLIYSFGIGENKEIAASSVNGNSITYVITKHPENDNGQFHRTFVKGNLCDRAGNLLIDSEAIDTTAPVLKTVTITNDGNYGEYCKAGTKIFVTATFDEAVANQNMKIKVKVGETEKGVIQGLINPEDNTQVIFTYVVQNGDNGEFKVLDVEGLVDNTIEDEDADKTYGFVEDSNGNRYRVYNFNIIVGRAIADTIDPYITQIEASENGRTRTIYEKESATDSARITAIRTNANIVEYTITYSEPVTKLDGDTISITNGSIIGEITPIGNNKFRVTIETNAEGVQSLTIRDATVEDIAGNTDKYVDGYLRLSAVTTDYTVPTVRFISEYNGGTYVLPTNINKIELRPNVEVSEDIDTIEYAWGDDEYSLVNNNSSSSDIAIPSNTVTEAGTDVLHIRVKDLAGNINEATKTYRVLRSNIVITDVTEEGTENQRLLNVLFEEGLTDNRKVEFKSNKTNQVITLRPTGTSENGATYTITENGVVYAEATDKAGHKVFREYEILIYGPEFEVVGNPTNWTNKDVLLEVVTDENIKSLTANGNNILAARKITVTQNGKYTFVATLEANGYRTSTTKEIDVTMIDKEAPIISDVGVTGKVISIAAVDRPEVGGSGIAEYAITTTTELPTEWSVASAIETTEDGVFYAWTRDKAGNTSIYSTPIIVDTTAPEISFEFAALKETVGKQIGAMIKTNEEAKISYRWENEGTEEEWIETDDFVTDVKAVKLARAVGDYTLYAKAVDRYGNETTVKKLEFKVVEKEEVQVPVIEFEDLTTVQIDGVKYVKVSPNMTTEAITGHMNNAKLLGVTPTYSNLTDDGKVKTGSEIKIDGATQYIIIVKGDVNCDGNVTVRDIISANAIRGEEETTNILKVLAADINGTNKIEVRDLISMNSFRTTE